MADFETITVTFKVDPDSIRHAYGLTPKASLQVAMEEMLEEAFSQQGNYCPNCDYEKPVRIRGHWHFHAKENQT